MNSGCIAGHRCAYNPRDPTIANICVPEGDCGSTIDMNNVMTKVECNSLKITVTGLAVTILALSYAY